MIEKRVDAVNRALSLEPVDGRRADQALPDPAQGARRGRRRIDPHAEGRRGFIAERYAPLIEGLYSGASEASISAEITYEDGRKGKLDGNGAHRRHAALSAASARPPARKADAA